MVHTTSPTAVMQGMTFASLKKNPSLVPLFSFMALGATMATLFTLRSATKNPDVAFNRTKNPNEDYRSKQFKFFNTHHDWSTYENPAPVWEVYPEGK